MTARRRLPLLPGVLMAAGVLSVASAQTATGSIYSCIDARGKRLTSDRLILECLDREQKEHKSDGTVRRIVGPSLTAQERAALEERERRAAEERQRQVDEKRAQRALLTRYPDQAAHDAERANALRAAQDVVASGRRRIAELEAQRSKLQQETEFYKNPSQWPARLKRQVDENREQIAGQLRFVQAQEQESKRIAARFDEELARLKILWTQAQQGTTTSGAAASTRPASAPR